jgi:hypothetical protein
VPAGDGDVHPKPLTIEIHGMVPYRRSAANPRPR